MSPHGAKRGLPRAGEGRGTGIENGVPGQNERGQKWAGTHSSPERIPIASLDSRPPVHVHVSSGALLHGISGVFVATGGPVSLTGSSPSTSSCPPRSRRAPLLACIPPRLPASPGCPTGCAALRCKPLHGETAATAIATAKKLRATGALLETTLALPHATSHNSSCAATIATPQFKVEISSRGSPQFPRQTPGMVTQSQFFCKIVTFKSQSSRYWQPLRALRRGLTRTVNWFSKYSGGLG